jgi:hypothetical protein
MDGFDPQQAMQALLGAAPQELDAHRNLLSEVFQTLEGQGVNTSDLAAQAGSATTDPCDMSHGDLVSTTLALAQQHPEIMQMVAQRFPETQGLLSTVLGGGGAQGGGNGGGFLGGLLGRL